MNINKIFAHVDELFENKNTDKVEPYLKDCIRQAEREDDLGSLIAICNELGGFYRALGRYEEGIPLYKKALSAVSTLGLQDTEHHATTLMNFATTYAVKGDPEQALKFFSLAAEIFRRANISSDYRIATLHNNMSILCQDTGDFKSALFHLQTALEVLKNLEKSEIEIAITYTNMAQIHLQAQEPDSAFAAIQNSIDIFQSQKQDVHYSAALETLGQIYLAQGKPEDALKCFKEAKALTERDYGQDSLAFESIVQAISECEKTMAQER